MKYNLTNELIDILAEIDVSIDDFDESGIYKYKGRFEGETMMTAYFYAFVMNGEGEAEESASTYKTTFDITDNDIMIFPELTGFNKFVVTITNDGFITGTYYI